MRKIKFLPLIILTLLRYSRLWSALRFCTTGKFVSELRDTLKVETEVFVASGSTLLCVNGTTRLCARPNSTVELIICKFYIVFLYQ
jgi:hypothetical protein